MSDKDNKRFFWLKLKKDFFQQHQLKVLKSLPNGRLYALIYLELLAESTSHNGELRYSQMLPYDIKTLASVIDEDIDNLKCAIETLINLELVEILEDKTIYMREIETMIGSETGQTMRKREAKLKGGKFYQKNTLESRYKSIEYRDKSIDNILKNNNNLLVIINRLKEAYKNDKLIDDAVILVNKFTDDITENLLNKSIEIISNEEIFNKEAYMRTVIENQG